MKERVCQFGRDLNLVGILAEPEEKDLRADAPTLLMLNAGLLHHVGPHRMSVELAHRLADKGIRSLRFDIGGYGDSELSTDADSDETLIVSDIKSAMDFLEAELNCHIFVLTGLCAGADNSHLASLRDARVVGEVLLDAPGYWTTRSYVTHYLPRMFRPGTWLRFFRRTLFPSKHAPEERTLLDQELRRPFGPKLQVEREIQSLVDRGTQMFYVYTGGVAKYYNYPKQFFDMFNGLDARGKIELEFYPSVDHTYTFAADRERMLARVVKWYCSRTWSANRTAALR